jgi:hypothetical protein
MTIKIHLAAAAASFLLATSGQASTISGVFDVTPAVSSSGTQHSLWFQDILAPGLVTTYTLTSPGTLTADANGATLTGSALNTNGLNAGFDMSFTYDRDFSDLPVQTPGFKDVFGTPSAPKAVPHGNEDYLDLESGVITGKGFFDGLVFTVTRAPVDGSYATQVGGGILPQTGANQHNANYGLSGWFLIDTVDSVNCANCTDQAFFQGLVGRQGDVNFNLSPALAAVPLPAAGFLLLGALASAMGTRTGKRKA